MFRSLIALTLALLAHNVVSQSAFTITDSELPTPAALVREGAVYGSADLDVVYIAGGVNFAKLNSTQSLSTYMYNNLTYTNQTASSFTVYDDVWMFNVTTKVFTPYSVNLTSPTYFGTGGWSYVVDGLVVYSGRNNTKYSQSQNTYFADIQIVDRVNLTNARTRVLTLTPAVTPRQFASSIIYNGTLFVFGGMTGVDGMTPVGLNDRFFCVNLKTGNTTLLDMTSSNAPTTTLINPVLFSSLKHDQIYVYSGMTSDYQTFASKNIVYVYSVTSNIWSQSITPTGALSNLAFAGWAQFPGYDYVMMLLIGGSYGMDQINGTSSTRDMYMIMPPLFDPTVNITSVPLHTIAPRERPIVGFTYRITGLAYELDIYFIGGANYNNTLQLARGSGMNGQANGTVIQSSQTLMTPVPSYVDFTTVFKITGTLVTINNGQSSSSSTGSSSSSSSLSSSSSGNSSTSSMSSSSTSSSSLFSSSSSSSSTAPFVPIPDEDGETGSTDDAATAVAVVLGLVFAAVVSFFIYKKFIMKPKAFVSGSEMTSPRVNRGGSIKGLVGSRGYQRTTQAQPNNAIDDQDDDQVLSSDESDLDYESGGDDEPVRKNRSIV